MRLSFDDCVVEHTVLDQHLDMIMGLAAGAFAGAIGWLVRLERRFNKSELNEHRIAAMEKRLEEEIMTAKKDHAEIRKGMTEIQTKLARIEGKLDKG